jgi:hypothetical protein
MTKVTKASKALPIVKVTEAMVKNKDECVRTIDLGYYEVVR